MTQSARGKGRFGAVISAFAIVLGMMMGGAGVYAQDATPEAMADPMTMYGPVQGNEPYRLAFMQVFPDNPFWQTMKEGVESRAAEDGVTVDIIALPTNAGVADQVAQMEDAVTQGYDGIILGTIDAAGIVPGIEAANAAGIPVLAVDTAPAGGDLISLVQTDNVAASRLARRVHRRAAQRHGQGPQSAGRHGQPDRAGPQRGAPRSSRRCSRHHGHRPERSLAAGRRVSPSRRTSSPPIQTSSPSSPPTTRRRSARCRRSRPPAAPTSSSSASTASRTRWRRSRMAR